MMPTTKTPESYWKNLSKYARHPVLAPDGFFELVELYTRTLTPWQFEPLQPLTTTQVLSHINRSKSSGPRLPRKKGGYVLGQDGVPFEDLVTSAERLYDQPPEQFTPPLWQVALKDELRDIARVAEGKTRTFMSAPIETCLGGLRIIAPYNERYCENHLSFPSTLGINKFNAGWSRLAGYLGTSDRVYLAADGSSFDASISPYLLSWCLWLRTQSLPAKYHRRLTNLYTETLYTPLVLADSTVRSKSTGVPSGSITTSFDDTDSLVACVYYALGRIFGQAQALEHLKSGVVRFVANGDDLGLSIHRSSYYDSFPTQLRESLGLCGLKYEFAEPVGDLAQYSFLGHYFQPRPELGPQVYWPLLPKNRILATCFYSARQTAPETYQRYLAALIHAYPYPDLYPKILSMIRKFLHRASVDREFCDPAYARLFPIFTGSSIHSLYQDTEDAYDEHMASSRPRELCSNASRREPQMAGLEDEAIDPRSAKNDPPSDPTAQSDADLLDLGSGPLQQGQPAFDTVSLNDQGQQSAPVRRAFLPGLDPTTQALFSDASAPRQVVRVLNSQSSPSQVQLSIRRLRDLLQLDDASTMTSVMSELIVYYADNSTSERNPHKHPYVHGQLEVSYADIDGCWVPTPRMFWRALANVTVNFLKANPDVFPHWGKQHGFPPKYREYAFDCADFATNVPVEAQAAIQAAKDAATTHSSYNLMRPDLKAVGYGGGTEVRQLVGAQFSTHGPSQSRRLG
jgi:hypothetical protein